MRFTARIFSLLWLTISIALAHGADTEAGAGVKPEGFPSPLKLLPSADSPRGCKIIPGNTSRGLFALADGKRFSSVQ